MSVCVLLCFIKLISRNRNNTGGLSLASQGARTQGGGSLTVTYLLTLPPLRLRQAGVAGSSPCFLYTLAGYTGTLLEGFWVLFKRTHYYLVDN